jgi:hypothetical protein
MESHGGSDSDMESESGSDSDSNRDDQSSPALTPPLATR